MRHLSAAKPAAMKARVLGLSALVILMTLGPAGAAGGPDASDPPRTTGPLVNTQVPCEDNDDAGPGGSTMQWCDWFYDLALDTSPTEETVVFWTQMEIEPAKGWCATELTFQTDLPEGWKILSASLEKSRRVSKDITKARLDVDGGGSGVVPASVEQDISLSSGREIVRMKQDRYSYTWLGKSRKKVMIAVGLELLQPAVEADPFTLWTTGGGGGASTCGAHSLTLRGK